jgi:hypothetical protein
VTTPSRTARLQDDQILMLMRNHARALEMLRWLYASEDRGASFKSVATAMEVSPRTVSDDMSRLNDAYGVLSGGGSLMERTGPAGSYLLTANGHRVGEALQVAHGRVYEGIARSTTDHRELWLPVTTECYGMFRDLAKTLYGSTGISLRPDPTRSADLHIHATADMREEELMHQPTHALYSACIEDDSVREGITLPEIKKGNPQAQVIVTRVQPFRLLAPTRKFGGQKTLSFKDMWSQGGQLVVPDGGAAVDFLDRVEPGWRNRRRFVRATDLEACLGCLANELVPDAVMVVHGLSDTKIPAAYSTYDIDDGPRAVAVSGLFQDNQLLSQGGHSVADKNWRQLRLDLWQVAGNIWVDREERIS